MSGGCCPSNRLRLIDMERDVDDVDFLIILILTQIVKVLACSINQENNHKTQINSLYMKSFKLNCWQYKVDYATLPVCNDMITLPFNNIDNRELHIIIMSKDFLSSDKQLMKIDILIVHW